MATTDPTSSQTPTVELRQSAERLLAEHQILMRGLGCHQEWIHQLSEIGMPRFGDRGVRSPSKRQLMGFISISSFWNGSRC